MWQKSHPAHLLPHEWALTDAATRAFRANAAHRTRAGTREARVTATLVERVLAGT
jgi:hypothetical protein